MDDLTLAELVGAYARRKRWEARLLAIEVVKALGEVMNPGSTAAGSQEKGISAEQFARLMG